MKARLPLLMLAWLIAARPALAQPVWDPTEVARLSEQAAQLGTNLSALIDNLQSFDKLASEVGAAGPRPLIGLNSSAPLLARLDLRSVSMPSGGDALALTSSRSMTESETQISRQTWNGALQKVTTEGLSMAQVSNQDLASANARSAALAAAAGGSSDLRGDVQANSAVCLAVLTELGSVHAVLALLLEQQSLVRLASTH